MAKKTAALFDKAGRIKKVLTALLLPSLLMAACACTPTLSGLVPSAGKKTDIREQRLDAKSRRYQMDSMEITLRQEISKIKEAQVQQLLTMTLPLEALLEPESSILKPRAYDKLFVITQILRNHPETNAIIAVQSDHSPHHIEDIKAAEQWASIIKNSLAGQGIDPERLITMGYGKTILPTGENAEKTYRRVQIILMPH